MGGSPGWQVAKEKERDKGPARGQLMLKDQDSVTGTILVQRLLNVASRCVCGGHGERGGYTVR